MLKIIKREGSPYWQITGTYQGQRVRESTGTPDKGTAEKILSKRIREIESRRVGKKTISDAIQAYKQSGGEEKYLDIIDEAIGDIELEDLTQEDIDRGAKIAYGGYKRGEKGKVRKHSASTIKRQYYTPLAAVIHYAADNKWMGYMRVRSPKVQRTAPKWAEPEWFESLWKVCGDDLKALTMFLFLTGCRIQECLDLEWKNLDLKKRTAFISKTKTGVHRTVLLPPRLIEAIGKPKDGRVFTFRDRRQVTYYLKMACEKAEIPYLTTHQLGSHSFATMMRKHAGMDARGLQGTGRWKSLQMVNHYTHTSISEESAKADILGELFK